jgi:hypothetical protein
MKKAMNSTFIECEHEGDAERVYRDIRWAGGYNIKYELNYEAEIAEFTWDVDDQEKFEQQFCETGSADFCGE